MYNKYLKIKSINIPTLINIKILTNKLVLNKDSITIFKYIPEFLSINYINNKLILNIVKYINNLKSQYNVYYTILKNKIQGLLQPFQKILNLNGIGFKCNILENILTFYLGFTHLIHFKIPDAISCTLESPIKLILQSIDKDQLGLFSNLIKLTKYPEPYKSKGIFYENETIKRKIGKRGK